MQIPSVLAVPYLTTLQGSKTPTFAAVKLAIHNERWEGVPIVIKAGKGLNEGVVVVSVACILNSLAA